MNFEARVRLYLDKGGVTCACSTPEKDGVPEVHQLSGCILPLVRHSTIGEYLQSQSRSQLRDPYCFGQRFPLSLGVNVSLHHHFIEGHKYKIVRNSDPV